MAQLAQEPAADGQPLRRWLLLGLRRRARRSPRNHHVQLRRVGVHGDPRRELAALARFGLKAQLDFHAPFYDSRLEEIGETRARGDIRRVDAAA